MTEHGIENTGRDALRELGPIEPLPADVLARLDARLEAETAPTVRQRKRRRLPRLAFAVPGLAVALAATVVAVVLVNRDETQQPRDVSALSQFKGTTEAVAPSAKAKASAPSASAGAGAPSSDAAAPVRVPAFAGHTLQEARALARARGLHVTVAPGTCTAKPSSHVSRQRPRAGTRAPVGSSVVLTAVC